MDDGHPYDDTVSFDFTLKPRTNPNPTLILILIQALEMVKIRLKVELMDLLGCAGLSVIRRRYVDVCVS